MVTRLFFSRFKVSNLYEHCDREVREGAVAWCLGWVLVMMLVWGGTLFICSDSGDRGRVELYGPLVCSVIMLIDNRPSELLA